MSVAPLSGIRVIDWTHVLAGPACAYYLGLLGAEVIKVERPGRGDAIRHRSGTDRARAAQGMSTAYMTQAGGKKSIALDLASEKGREAFDRLLRSADVLVENHRPSTLAGLGLTESQTRAMNPGLVHCAMTGFGRGSDMADAPAYDVNIQAISGLMALTGTQETGPTRTGAPVIDYATGLAGALGVMSALMARARTGHGAFVDVSMLETAFTLMSSTIADYQLTGTAPKPRGNAANSRSPSSGTFDCKVGLISLGVNEEAQFSALAAVLGRSDWMTDPRFSTAKARDENADALFVELSAVLLTQTAEQWERTLMCAGVPCARVRTLADALMLPAATERDFATRGAGGFAGLPFRSDQIALERREETPSVLGADTRAILASLGYSEDEVAAIDAASLASPV